jgi:hypothetical protein
MAKAKLDLTGLIDTGINLALGFLGKLFSGKTKKAVAEMQTRANQALEYDEKQSGMIRLLIAALVIIALLVVYFFVIRRKK